MSTRTRNDFISTLILKSFTKKNEIHQLLKKPNLSNRFYKNNLLISENEEKIFAYNIHYDN